MDAKIASAAEAYGKAVQATTSGAGLEGGDKTGAADAGGATDFSAILERSLEGVVEAGLESEAASIKSVSGDAALTDIVTAVSNAEITLQTVVAVRDKVLQAYQEIIRMPI
jgi:flagellar hook-basal body complex protein FliE